MVTLTGLGLKFAHLVLQVAGGNLLLTLFLTMIASIILGMGLPTTAKYIVLATIAAPALVELGVPLLAAHLFIFYFGIIADITPPVALAAYAGAGIAGGNAMKTGLTAVKLASAAFLIPYIFAISPGLLLIDVTWLEALHNVATALMGIIALATAAQGFFIAPAHLWERVLLFGAALGLIDPGLLTDTFGLVAFGVVYLVQRRRARSVSPATP